MSKSNVNRYKRRILEPKELYAKALGTSAFLLNDEEKSSSQESSEPTTPKAADQPSMSERKDSAENRPTSPA